MDSAHLNFLDRNLGKPNFEVPTLRPHAVLALLFALAPLAGCIGPDALPEETEALAAEAAPTPQEQSNGSTPPATGTLLVTARMPDQTLLGGVILELGNATATTDAQGQARFEAVAPGAHELVARKEAHRTARQTVEIRAAAETSVEIVLAPEGNDQHAHEAGVFAHRDLYTFQGHFDCSATYVIITGDCLILVENVTGTAGVADPASNATSERYLIDFPLDTNWTSLVVEMTWTPTVPTAATGESMSLALEPAEAPADGHAAKYARAVGASPIRLDLAPGAPHESATTGDMPNPAGGEVIRARVFTAGALHNPGGTTFLGVGAAAQHEFTLYVSIFYEEPAPAGYTALGGA